MNARLFQNLIFITLLFIVLFVSSSFGQESLSPNLQLLQAQIDQKKELVAGWEFSAIITFFLAILVVFLGAVVALVQKFEGRKWCPVVVVVSGILISIITFATKEYYEVDHKTYRKSAATARREISNAEICLAIVKIPETDPADRQLLLVRVAESIRKIDTVADNIEKTSTFVASSGNASYFGFSDDAYAQASSSPSWVSQTRTDTSTVHRFVGTGKGPSVSAAQSMALQNAQNATASGLLIPLETVKKYSVLVDTYLEYNAQQRTYLCYAKVELNKAFVHR
jgi:hypothetical protein